MDQGLLFRSNIGNLLITYPRSGIITRRACPKKTAQQLYTDTIQNAASKSRNTVWGLIQDV